MKTVIIYISQHGCAKKCALRLQELMKDEPIDMINLKSVKKPSLSQFDAVIIGGSIHAGSIQSQITQFISSNINRLLTKKVGLYICHMKEGAEAQKEFENVYPQLLRDHAVAHGLFGGEFDMKKMNFIEKFIAKNIAHTHESVSKINNEAIQQFAEEFN